MAEQVVDQLVQSGMLVQQVMAQMQAQQQQDNAQKTAEGLAGKMMDRAGGAADVIGGPERNMEGLMGGGGGGRIPVGMENAGMANAGV
jgi:hypothetical protein